MKDYFQSCGLLDQLDCEPLKTPFTRVHRTKDVNIKPHTFRYLYCITPFILNYIRSSHTLLVLFFPLYTVQNNFLTLLTLQHKAEIILSFALHMKNGKLYYPQYPATAQEGILIDAPYVLYMNVLMSMPQYKSTAVVIQLMNDRKMTIMNKQEIHKRKERLGSA
jgi:hypothetical protein